MRRIVLTGFAQIALVLAATFAMAEERKEVVNQSFACTDQRAGQRAFDLLTQQRDVAAAGAVMKREGCRWLETGSLVYVEQDESRRGGWICVRPMGSPDCYWAHPIIFWRR